MLRPLIRSVSPYVPGQQPAEGTRVVKLNTNENPYPPSPRVLQALAASIGPGLRLYPDPDARGLRGRLGALCGVPTDAVVVGNGSDELISLLVRAVVEPGGRVAYPVPTYSLYETVVALHGAQACEVPFPEDYGLPETLADTGAALTFVCNPNSPSGTMVGVNALTDLANRIPGVLVVDEAYVDFADGNALELVGRCDNVVLLRTFSKSFALAGLRIGFAVGHPDLMAGLRTLKDSYNVSRLSQAAACAALDDLAWVADVTRRIRTTRTRLVAGLEALAYRVLPSQANFVLARRPGVDQGEVVARLADRGILVRHFAVPRLADALRITVGTDEEIDAFLEALRQECG